MNETEYHSLADATLDTLLERLEELDAQGMLEVEYQGGVMNIQLPAGQSFVLSKHFASKQLWLSSPVSGGLHFSWNGAKKQWLLADGSDLSGILTRDLRGFGVEARF